MAFKNSGDIKPFVDKIWDEVYYWGNQEEKS